MSMNKVNSKRQAGFSLIELLVVVAIIGVLAAAGMVGYSSYLNGVKVDTHKNNAKAIAQALKTTAVARAGGLSGIPGMCDDKTDENGRPVAQGSGAQKSREQCAAFLAADFTSTLLTTKVTGGDYVVAAPDCSNSAGKLVVQQQTDSPYYTFNILACSTDTNAPILDTVSYGSDW